jgi:hypothetical protein
MAEVDVDALIGVLMENISAIDGDDEHGQRRGNGTHGPGGGDHQDNDVFHQRFINAIAFQIVICLSYALIFLVGIMGNILVCYIVYSRKHMQNVTNYFITKSV